MSHPTRVRGLKLFMLVMPMTQIVAPHTGAWIETAPASTPTPTDPVAPHTGAWIETRRRPMCCHCLACRTPHGCVD